MGKGIPYCGMRGPPGSVGQYYAAAGLGIVTGGGVVPYFRKDGNIQVRDAGTGRFISPESALQKLRDTPTGLQHLVDTHPYESILQRLRDTPTR